MRKPPPTTFYTPNKYPLPTRAMIYLRAAADNSLRDPELAIRQAIKGAKLLQEELHGGVDSPTP